MIKEVFPNAQIITDRYHVVQLLNRHLNILRTVIMNKFKNTDIKKYRRLKRYWKLLLKSSDELLTYSAELKTAYHYIQDLRTLLDTGDSEGFLNELNNIPDTFTREFKSSLRRLKNNKEELINAMNHTYSNGPLEGLIDHFRN